MALEWLPVGLSPGGIRQGPMRRLDAGARPEAVFALDHITAAVAIDVLKRLDVGIPGEVALASFDDMEWMTLVSPGITAIEQPVEEMARAAQACLSRRSAGDTDPPETLRLHGALIPRASTMWPVRRHGGSGARGRWGARRRDGCVPRVHPIRFRCGADERQMWPTPPVRRALVRGVSRRASASTGRR